jgi:CubicO group peptidase (beta-lactamase class C family)
MPWTKAIALAVAVVLGGSGALAAPARPAVKPVGRVIPAKITAALKGLVDNDRLVGVSALVTQNGKEVYFGAFGYADREAGRRMARDTIVQIFSMTKPVVGVALMQLWEQGKFRLDDPVAKYIPELANVQVFAGLDAEGKPVLVAPDRPMTIRDLTRHTAGLTYCGKDNLPELAPQCTAADMHQINDTLDVFAQKLGTLPLEFQPGEKWRYSFAVDVQALLVQRLSGEPYDKYIEEHIFKPLGMSHTGFYVPPEARGRLAAMYTWNADGSFTRMPDAQAFMLNTAHWPRTPGGSGLTSTLDDYSRFARMLLNDGELDGVRVLKPSTVRTMSTSQLDPAVTDRIWLNADKGEVGFGIDVAVRVDPPAKPGGKAGEVGEFFWDGFANTLFWVDPQNHLTAVLFTQYQPFGKVPLHKAFRDAVYEGVDPGALAPKK